MKKYLLLFLVILNWVVFIFGKQSYDNYTDAIAGENGSCVVVDQANYNLLMVPTSLRINFVSDLVHIN